MTLDKQVISLNLAKQLSQQGCIAESLFTWVADDDGVWTINFSMGNESRYESYPAYTASELDEMIGPVIKRHGVRWHPFLEREDTLANRWAKILIFLVELDFKDEKEDGFRNLDQRSKES